MDQVEHWSDLSGCVLWEQIYEGEREAVSVCKGLHGKGFSCNLQYLLHQMWARTSFSYKRFVCQLCQLPAFLALLT